MSSTPVLSQDAFRLRNDDGNETTASWVANENTNATLLVDNNYRVRFVEQATSAAAATNRVFQLQYSLNDAAWTDVTGSSSFVRSSASPNLTDAANLTDQMTAGSGTFIGTTGFDEADGAAGGNSLDMAASGQAQTEYCFQIRAADLYAQPIATVPDGANNIKLRVRDTQSNLNTWNQIPSITVNLVRKGLSDAWANLADTTLSLRGDHYLGLVDLDALPAVDDVAVNLGEAAGTTPKTASVSDPWANLGDAAPALFETYSPAFSDSWANEADTLSSQMTYSAALVDSWVTLGDAFTPDLQSAAATPINVNNLAIDSLNNWQDSLDGRRSLRASEGLEDDLGLPWLDSRAMQLTEAAALSDSWANLADGFTPDLKVSVITKSFSDLWANEADALAGRETYAAAITDPWGNLADSVTPDLQTPDIRKTYSDPWANLSDTAIRTIGDHYAGLSAAANNWGDQASAVIADAQVDKTFTATDSLNNWAELSQGLFGDYLATQTDAWGNLADSFTYDLQIVGTVPKTATFSDAWANEADNVAGFFTYAGAVTDPWANFADAFATGGQGDKAVQLSDAMGFAADSLAGRETYAATASDSWATLADSHAQVKGLRLPVFTDAWANLADSATSELIKLAVFSDAWANLADTTLARRVGLVPQFTDDWATLADSVKGFYTYAAKVQDAWANLADQIIAGGEGSIARQLGPDSLNNWLDSTNAAYTLAIAISDAWGNLNDSHGAFCEQLCRLSDAAPGMTDQIAALLDCTAALADDAEAFADLLFASSEGGQFVMLAPDAWEALADEIAIHMGMSYALIDIWGNLADALAVAETEFLVSSIEDDIGILSPPEEEDRVDLESGVTQNSIVINSGV